MLSTQELQRSNIMKIKPLRGISCKRSKQGYLHTKQTTTTKEKTFKTRWNILRKKKRNISKRELQGKYVFTYFKSFKEVKVPIRGYRLPLILPINNITTKPRTKRTITETHKAQNFKTERHQREAADSRNHWRTDLHNAELNSRTEMENCMSQKPNSRKV